MLPEPEQQVLSLGVLGTTPPSRPELIPAITVKKTGRNNFGSFTSILTDAISEITWVFVPIIALKLVIFTFFSFKMLISLTCVIVYLTLLLRYVDGIIRF